MASAVLLTCFGSGQFALAADPAAASKTPAPSTTAPDNQISKIVPDMNDINPLLHRVGTNNSVTPSLATVLQLRGNPNWRCREMYLDPRDEPNTRYTLMLGRDDPDDMILFDDQIKYYAAFHVKVDGTFVTGVVIDEKTGKGIRINWQRAEPLVEAQIATWNRAAGGH